jgi:hypothetical protein
MPSESGGFQKYPVGLCHACTPRVVHDEVTTAEEPPVGTVQVSCPTKRDDSRA